jgi:hypothetical protein
MKVDHVRIEELVVARALGGLEPAEAAELDAVLAGHGASCQECRRLVDEYEEVAGRMAFAVAPDEVPTGMEDRVVERATRSSNVIGLGARSMRRALAGVAAAVLVVAGGLGGYLLHGGGGDGIQGVQLAADGGTGSLTLVYQPDTDRSLLIGSGLGSLPADRVYELWMIRDGTPQRAATFLPSDHLVLEVPADVSGADQVAVTVERAPGVAAPTTTPIFSAPVAA